MSSFLSFHPAEPKNAHEMILCPQDARERDLLGLSHPEIHLARAIELYPACTQVRDSGGRLVALGGLVRYPRRVTPWLLLSVHCKPEHKHAILRRCLGIMKHLQEDANRGVLVGNHVSRCNTAARAFLCRLGFHIVSNPVGPFDLFYLPPNNV